jgi:BTB/POZ domain-containing protein 9
VTFIKIVGTKNTANEVFHVVHFECPATRDVPSSSQDNSTTKQQPQPQSNLDKD